MPYRRPMFPGVAILLVVLVAWLIWKGWQRNDEPANGTGGGTSGSGSSGAGAGEYLLCFWNAENFFDDKEEPHANRVDKPYDDWFAHNPAVLQEKLDHLSTALLDLNDKKGPDILALAEVESERAADLLREALNKRLKDSGLHYGPPLFREVSGGRHIAPAILTRLPVERNRTQQVGKRTQRILEGHVKVNDHDLVLVASHWTSRVSDEEGEGRDKYANTIYGRFREMVTSNPKVDFVVCGDFNDSPDDESVKQHLHATADVSAVRRGGAEPLLLDLMAGRDPEKFGTHYHNKWFIFDHIVVSPGMLDNEGWSVEPETVHTVNTLFMPRDKLHRPWRFGNEHDKGDRGYSDHFPVTVRLRVH